MRLIDGAVIHLHKQPQPVAIGDIARALNVAAESVNVAITELIKSCMIKRNHCPDAVLRYDCTEKGTAHAEKLLRNMQLDQRIARFRHISPNGRKVMEALARANGSLTREGLFVALRGALTREQLQNVLSRLRHNSHVLSPRTGTRGLWCLACPEEWSFLLPRTDEAAAMLADTPTVQPSQDAIERLAQDAQAATASLLEALALVPDRSPALVKVAAANSLLVEARSIVHQEQAA